MLFATTGGEFAFNVIVWGWLLLFFYKKLFAAADTDGELKKTAGEQFLGWLDRRLK